MLQWKLTLLWKGSDKKCLTHFKSTNKKIIADVGMEETVRIF